MSFVAAGATLVPTVRRTDRDHGMDTLSTKELNELVKSLHATDCTSRDALLKDVLVYAYPTLRIQNN